jgi:hypothetical protein
MAAKLNACSAPVFLAVGTLLKFFALTGERFGMHASLFMQHCGVFIHFVEAYESAN